MVFLAIFAELITVELSAVVHYEGMRHAKPSGDVLVDEGLYVALGDSGQCLGHGPFREVIHGDYYVLALPLGRRREGAKEVEPPLGEWPRASQWHEVSGRGLLHGGVLLAFVAALDKFFGVAFHGRPILSEPQGADVERAALDMVAAHPGVEFVEYALPSSGRRHRSSGRL